MNSIDIADEAPHEVTEPVAPRRRGRPTTLTFELFCRAAALIAKGLTEEQACVRVGVNHNTFRTARHRYPHFETALKEAQAEFVDMATDKIIEGKQGCQALAWILERRHGDQFRRNTGMELSGAVGTHSSLELALKRPLQQWTEADMETLLTFSNSSRSGQGSVSTNCMPAPNRCGVRRRLGKVTNSASQSNWTGEPLASTQVTSRE